MIEKYTFDECSKNMKKKWQQGLVNHDGKYVSDGMAILSNFDIKKYDDITLTKAPMDEQQRPDFRKRIVQNVDFGNGLKISNVHFASNNNAYLQLKELIQKGKDRLIIGDFNMTNDLMQKHKNIWDANYTDSTSFQNYISFIEDGVAYDHLLLPKSYKFISIQTVDGLSDHSAVIFEIKKD
jgi:endonuclease/exonuclease/phosphatase family metal-dependent hydrolase